MTPERETRLLKALAVVGLAISAMALWVAFDASRAAADCQRRATTLYAPASAPRVVPSTERRT